MKEKMTKITKDRKMFNIKAIPNCISGDTLIKTVEYGDIEIEKLIDKEFGVWSFSETDGLCIKKAYKVRKTKNNTHVLKIKFDE